MTPFNRGPSGNRPGGQSVQSRTRCPGSVWVQYYTCREIGRQTGLRTGGPSVPERPTAAAPVLTGVVPHVVHPAGGHLNAEVPPLGLGHQVGPGHQHGHVVRQDHVPATEYTRLTSGGGRKIKFENKTKSNRSLSLTCK